LKFSSQKRLYKQSLTEFKNKVYQAARKIPQGKVTTYSEIARAIGKPKAARAVGNAMHENPFAPQVPCHRVVKSNGQVGGFASGAKRKIELLKKEGVSIENGKVVCFKDKLYRFNN